MSDQKQLDAVLIGMVGRRLTKGEIYDALEISSTTYSTQLKEDRLTTANNLLTAARNLNLNPVELLVAFDLLTDGDVAAYVEGRSSSPFSLASREGGIA